MTEEQQEQPKSYFPNPPQFFRHFTDSNVGNLESAFDDDSTTLPIALKLPSEVRYLLPPAQPTDSKWKSFGDLHELHPAPPSLEDQGIDRLYPAASLTTTISLFQNVPAYLKQMIRSIIANYLELLGIIAVDPAQAEPKIKALRDIFINGEHLINLYRPHQARESLILMMEDELDNKREIVRKVNDARMKLYATLDRATRSLEDPAKRTQVGCMPDLNAEQNLSAAILRADEESRQNSLWSALGSAENETARLNGG